MSSVNEVKAGNVKIGGDNPLVLIAGPCVIEDEKIIERILRHLVLWARKARPPPKAKVQPLNVRIDYADSQSPPSDDYLYCDPDYPIETYATD